MQTDRQTDRDRGREARRLGRIPALFRKTNSDSFEEKLHEDREK